MKPRAAPRTPPWEKAIPVHPLGWEIDHIVSIERGGLDPLDNLRPLNWRSNAGRARLPRWLLKVAP